MSVLCDNSLKSELLYFADDGFPSARDLRITGGQISTGDLQIDGGLLFRLVSRVEQPRCFRPLTGAQTPLLSSQIVVNVKSPSAFTPRRTSSERVNPEFRQSTIFAGTS
jgi:hypothetical protein